MRKSTGALKQLLIKLLLFIYIGGFCSASFAAPIPFSDVVPTANPASSGPFVISQISDGINADFPYNGFVANVRNGTISFDILGGPWDMNSFMLWNDINIEEEGVATFRLDFFDDTNTLISSTSDFTTVHPSPLAGETFSFPVVSGVSSVDLVVLSVKEISPIRRIEIREVGFDGTKTSEPVPVLGGFGIFILMSSLLFISRKSLFLRK